MGPFFLPFNFPPSSLFEAILSHGDLSSIFFNIIVSYVLPITVLLCKSWFAIRVHVTLHVTVNVGFVATHAFAKKFRWFAALIFDVTIQTILPFVLAFAHFAWPWFIVAPIVNHIDGLTQWRRWWFTFHGFEIGYAACQVRHQCRSAGRFCRFIAMRCHCHRIARNTGQFECWMWYALRCRFLMYIWVIQLPWLHALPWHFYFF